MEQPFEFGPIQTAWLEALESGKYEQGTLHLKYDNRYCCLGVLCEVMGLPFGHSHGQGPAYSDGVTSSSAEVPLGAASRAGLNNGWGEIKGDDEHRSLIYLNDKKEFDFRQIAAFIRANPKKIFTKAA